jgi:hypothetical protein
VPNSSNGLTLKPSPRFFQSQREFAAGSGDFGRRQTSRHDSG